MSYKVSNMNIMISYGYSDYTQNVKILSTSNRSVTCVLYHNIYDVQLLQNNK